MDKTLSSKYTFTGKGTGKKEFGSLLLFEVVYSKFTR